MNLKKKWLFLVSLFLFLIIPYKALANTCSTYQCIICSYKVFNYKVTYQVSSLGSNTQGQVKFIKKKNSDEDCKFKQTLEFINFVKNRSRLYCPTIYAAKNGNTININSSKTNGYSKIKATVSQKNDNPLTKEALEEKAEFYASTQNGTTDWGEVKDTDLQEICNNPSFQKPMKLIGTIINFVKILIVGIIIVLGIFDLFKATTSMKDNRFIVAVKSIAIRVIAGVCIFFLPGVIQVILDMVNEWSNYQNVWCCCTQCLLDADHCDINSCSSDSCQIGG